MSFDKYYPNRKDWRKPYRRSKAFDSSCRNHGSCPYCERSRLHNSIVRIEAAKQELRDYLFSAQQSHFSAILK